MSTRASVVKSIRNFAAQVVQWVVTLVVIGAVAAAAIVTSPKWYPHVASWWTTADDAAGEEHVDEDDHHDPNVLELSAAARKSMRLRVEPLARTPHSRTISMPALAVPIAGVSLRDVTAKSSGEITGIHVVLGQPVAPDGPLFDIVLTHQEAIDNQIKLIDSLAELEAVESELARLEELEERRPGAVEGVRLINKRFERAHLRHMIASHRQSLLLLGLSPEDVEELVAHHTHAHADTGHDPMHDSADPLLIDRLRISAPPPGDVPALPMAQFVVDSLPVRLGQHVDAGDLLCRLADYSRLFLEGSAFEQDLSAVRRAMDQGWPITAVLHQRQGPVELSQPLRIVYVDPTVEAQSRSARFYVALENEPRRGAIEPGQFADWRFLPGQRFELRVPLEEPGKRLVLPTSAVAQDGLENYVFQAGGKAIVRRPVTVAYRDANVVVLDEDDNWLEGASLAMTGAYQLQLALLNRAAGPAQAHSHSH
jgi:multidrug efflux pump subunit AcrA (membrane-fusion protein)